MLQTSEMPLQERNEEIEKALEALRINRENIKSKSKQKHCFYAILAGSGSGKTRLSEEILHSIEHKYPNETYSVRIDFSNGDVIQPAVESKYPSHMLGLRVAARLLFGCSTKELISYLNDQYAEVLFEVFGFEEVMAAFYERRKQLEGPDPSIVNMVLVMDDINYVPSIGKCIFNDMLATIGCFMCDTTKACQPTHLQTQSGLAQKRSAKQNPAAAHRVALLPVICGTTLASLQSEFVATGYRYFLGAVNPLSDEGIKNIFTSLYPANQSWLHNEIFDGTLKLLGQIPRCLKHIMEVCQSYTTEKKLTYETAKDIAEKAFRSINSHYLVCLF